MNGLKIAWFCRAHKPKWICWRFPLSILWQSWQAEERKKHVPHFDDLQKTIDMMAFGFSHWWKTPRRASRGLNGSVNMSREYRISVTCRRASVWPVIVICGVHFWKKKHFFGRWSYKSEMRCTMFSDGENIWPESCAFFSCPVIKPVTPDSPRYQYSTAQYMT